MPFLLQSTFSKGTVLYRLHCTRFCIRDIYMCMHHMMHSTSTRTNPCADRLSFAEWFSFLCMLFTFTGLVEYGIVLGILRPRVDDRVQPRKVKVKKLCHSAIPPHLTRSCSAVLGFYTALRVWQRCSNCNKITLESTGGESDDEVTVKREVINLYSLNSRQLSNKNRTPD